MPRFRRYNYDKMANRADAQFREDRPLVIAIDTETEGFAWTDPAFCVTVTWRETKPYPDGMDRTLGLKSFYLDLDFDDHGHRLAVIRHMLLNTPCWVFHNAKFDLQKLLLEDCIDASWIKHKVIEDTALIHALLDENDRHGLKYLAHKLLGESTNEEKILAKVRRKLKIKKDEGYHLLPREVVVPYAMKDTEFTLRLYELLRPKLPQELEDLYAAETQVALALLDVEAAGIGLDVPYLEKTASAYGVKLMRLDAKLQKLAAAPNDAKFNPNSPKQIMEAFERRGITLSATDKATLSEVDDELAEVLLAYRNIKKMHSTYLVGMLAEQKDGVIHPNFNTTLPRTGRMSSSSASNN